MAIAGSLLAAGFILIGAGYFVVRAGTLAADAHQRDLRVSEHAFTVTFYALAVFALAIAMFAVIAVRALWAGRRWGWWSLTILATLEVLSMLGRVHSWFGAAQVLPTIVAFIALLTRSARAFVRPTGRATEGTGWAGSAPAYGNASDWLQGR